MTSARAYLYNFPPLVATDREITPMTRNAIPFALAALAVGIAFAADYYVSPDGNDENDGLSAETPFRTVDHALSLAGPATNIYLASGTYETSTQYGPSLAGNLIGRGATRDDVILRPAGDNRTLRTTATAFVSNLTIIGNADWKVDKGGAVEMSGGTIVDCVISNGTAYANGNLSGGNLYMKDSSIVSHCDIACGSATNRGGNVYLDSGTISGCSIRDGRSSNVGGNLFLYNGTVTNCTVSGGISAGDGGNVRMHGGSPLMVDCTVSDGTITSKDKKGANAYLDGSARLVRCRLTGGSNGVGYNSGSVCVYSESAMLDSCLIERSAVGGILYGSKAKVCLSTIVNNGAYGIWNWAQRPRLYGCAIFGNGPGADWSGDAPTKYADSDVRGCAVPQSVAWSGAYPTVIAIDETAFADYVNGDYRPAPRSPLIDAGCTDTGCFGGDRDIVGNVRLVKAADIGCYETQTSTIGDMVWVNAGSTPKVPYATPETGLRSVSEAVNVLKSTDGGIVNVAPGTYGISAQITISTNLSVLGCGDAPESVVVRQTSEATSGNQYCRVFEVVGNGAIVANLTMENGSVYRQNGGNLRITAGMASNCVIRGGTVTAEGKGSAGGAGVEIGAHGLVTHCWITNNVCVGTSSDANARGGAVFWPYNSKGSLHNSLVAYNVYRPSTDNELGAAGLMLYGGNDAAVIENCTVASNVVEGSVDTAAGATSHSSWYTTFRNCVFAGNCETSPYRLSSAFFTKETKVYQCIADAAPTGAEKYHEDSTGFTLGTAMQMFRSTAASGVEFMPLPGGMLYNHGVTPSRSVAVDLAGAPRIAFGAIDVGCYESRHRPMFVITVR